MISFKIKLNRIQLSANDSETTPGYCEDYYRIHSTVNRKFQVIKHLIMEFVLHHFFKEKTKIHNF